MRAKESSWFNIFINGSNPFLWLTAIGFLLYLPSLFFNFTYLDDNVLILDNLRFLQNPANLFKTFSQEVFHILHFSAAYYRPILTISFMIDSWFSGSSPFFYHLTNVLIHLTAANLLFIFLQKLQVKQHWAFLTALISAVHPVLVQAVSWIPGRNDSLLAVFILLSFIAIIDYIEKPNLSSFLIHLSSFFLALFTKESALILIPLILFFAKFLTPQKISLPNLIKIILGWLMILIFWFILRQNALVNPIKMSLADMVLAMILNSPAAIQLLGKIFLPFNLSVLPIMQDTTFILGFISLIAILLFIILSLFPNMLSYPVPENSKLAPGDGGVKFIGLSVRGKVTDQSQENNVKRIDKQKSVTTGLYQTAYSLWLIFGLFWFLGFLLPSFIRPNTEIAADFLEHRLYLPIIGVFIIFLKSNLLNRINFNNRWMATGIILLIFLLSFKNITHQFNFKNRLSFWQNASQNSPHSPLAHRNLGVMLYFEGKDNEALTEYQRALKLNPDEPMAHNNIGVIFMKQNKWNEAEKEFNEELKNNPNYDNALNNLGLIYYQEDKKDKAVKLWQEVIKINPEYWDAYKNLAAYFYSINDLQNANYYASFLPK